MKLPINKFLHELRSAVKADGKTRILFFSIGNPRPRWDHTRHSVGHLVSSAVIDRMGGIDGHAFGPLKQAPNLWFAQSGEMMNLSGRALQHVLWNLGSPKPWQVVVIHDDMDLDVGEVKFKLPSSAFGGHNGLRDIVSRCGPVSRIRVGIGAPSSMDSKSVTSHVLGKFRPIEARALRHSFDSAADIVAMVAGCYPDTSQK